MKAPAGHASAKDRGRAHIIRTTQQTYLRVASGYLPAAARQQCCRQDRRYSASLAFYHSKDANGKEFSRHPNRANTAGTPVNLLSNLDLMSDSTNRAERLEHNAQVLCLSSASNTHLKACHPSLPTIRSARRSPQWNPI